MAVGLQTYTAMCNPMKPDTLEEILHDIDPIFDDYDVELIPLATLPGVPNCRHALIVEKKPAPQKRINYTFDHSPKKQCPPEIVKAIHHMKKELHKMQDIDWKIVLPIKPGQILEQQLALLG